MNLSDFYDVIVVGGGFSGVAAAIAAARGAADRKVQLSGSGGRQLSGQPFYVILDQNQRKKNKSLPGYF